MHRIWELVRDQDHRNQSEELRRNVVLIFVKAVPVFTNTWIFNGTLQAMRRFLNVIMVHSMHILPKRGKRWKKKKKRMIKEMTSSAISIKSKSGENIFSLLEVSVTPLRLWVSYHFIWHWTNLSECVSVFVNVLNEKDWDLGVCVEVYGTSSETGAKYSSFRLLRKVLGIIRYNREISFCWPCLIIINRKEQKKKKEMKGNMKSHDFICFAFKEIRN